MSMSLEEVQATVERACEQFQVCVLLLCLDGNSLYLVVLAAAERGSHASSFPCL